MKRLIYILLAIVSMMTVSCMKDGEMLIATIDGDGSTIGTVDDNIVLTSDRASALALTIYWDELGNATLSNPDAQLPEGAVVNSIQFSASEDFGTYVEQSVPEGASSVQFTVAALNNLLSGLGFEAGVPTKIYVRMQTAMGTGSEAVYGNVLELTITTYTIDMSYITLAGSNQGAYTGVEAKVSAEAGVEGSYKGFAHIAGEWWNCFFVEGNGNIWGAEGTDPNNPFPLDQKSDISSWNVWFPAPKGCYWIDVDLSVPEWSCVNLNEVTAKIGEADANAMSYFSNEVKYYLVFTTAEDNVPVQTEYTGILYNSALGTGSQQTAGFPFVCAADGSLSVGETGAASGITVATAGTYTLILDLADMTWELAEGEVDVAGGGAAVEWPADDAYAAAASDNLYIYSLSDKTPASSVATLAKTADGVYEGFFYMTSWYNFKLGDAEDPAQATVIYGSCPSSTIEGALYRLYCSDDMNNIWWDSGTAGYVYLTVNTNTRSWSYTEVTTIHIAGDFNSWSTTGNPMSLTETGTWMADIVPGSWGESGIQFLLNFDAQEWNWSYAPQTGGSLVENNDKALVPDVTVTDGTTYRVTIDLISMTWAIVEYDPSQEPAYSEYLYMFYTWNSGWQEKLASTLYSAAADGVYTGYFTSGTVWQASGTDYDTQYVHYSFGSTTTANSGTQYYVTDNTTIYKSSGTTSGTTGWLSGLGVTSFTVSLVDMTVSQTYLGTPAISNQTTSTNVTMAFDDVTDFVWKGTATFAAGDTFTITVGDSLTLGGSDGTLTENGSAITVDTAGTYSITVDLSTADALKYTLTIQ